MNIPSDPDGERPSIADPRTEPRAPEALGARRGSHGRGGAWRRGEDLLARV